MLSPSNFDIKAINMYICMYVGSALRRNAMQCTARQGSAMQCNAMHCNVCNVRTYVRTYVYMFNYVYLDTYPKIRITPDKALEGNISTQNVLVDNYLDCYKV